MTKLIQIISNVLLAVSLLLAVLFLANRFLNPHPLHVYIVSSGSMSPQIPTGSLIISIPMTSYKVGDVVTFKTGAKQTTTHRIVGISDGLIKTAGDANNQPEPTLTSESQIVGKVVFHIPYVGFMASKAKTPIGFILFVVVPATIIIYEEVKSLSLEILKSLPRISNPSPLYVLAVLLPLIGGSLIFTSFSHSFFSDVVTVPGNKLSVSVPTPTLSPTPLPSISPSIEISTSPTSVP